VVEVEISDEPRKLFAVGFRVLQQQLIDDLAIAGLRLDV
jgi:hypothetical protein